MLRRKPTFINKFDALAKREGFDSISDFVDDWISKGGTFRTIHDLVLLNDINVDRYTVWLSLRHYLTIPYGGDDAYWYKWDSLARTKGKNNIAEWMDENRGKFTTMEIAREFNVTIRPIEKLVQRIDRMNNKEVKKYRRYIDYDGFTMTHTKERWLKVANKLGYKTLREAVRGMDDKGMSSAEMAEIFGVDEKTFKRRLKRANLALSIGRRRQIKINA